MGVIGGTVSMTNFVDALCLLLSLVIMLLLLAHRPTWPLTKRPTYAANRKQIIQNTDLLGAVGTMLILYAFPQPPRYPTDNAVPAQIKESRWDTSLLETCFGAPAAPPVQSIKR
jgi:hypothetical protein